MNSRKIQVAALMCGVTLALGGTAYAQEAANSGNQVRQQSQSTVHVSQQLGELTGNCVACHRAYRLATSDTE